MRGNVFAGVIAIGISLLVSNPARAGKVLEDFSSGTLDGWTSSGAWFVSGTTNSSPSIAPPDGLAYQALSGVPNQPSEADVGTLTSPVYTVSFSTLSFLAAGWSGSNATGNGESYYEILNQNGLVLTTIGTAQADYWVTKSVDLFSLGLVAGEGFSIRAVDGRDEYNIPGGNYSWMGIDLVQESGAAVPEPASFGLMLAGAVAIVGVRLLRRGVSACRQARAREGAAAGC